MLQDTVSAVEIERTVSDLEGICIVIRAKRGQRGFQPYAYQRRSAGNITVNEWIALRLEPILNGAELEVIRGDGSIAPRQTTLDTVRKSYIQ